MKYLRILPEMWASTTCSFSSSTLNMALGRVSTTVPVTSIASAFPALGPSEAGLVPCLFFFLFPVRKRGRYGRLAIHSSPLQKSSRGQGFNSSSKTPQTRKITGFIGDYQPIHASVRVPGSTFTFHVGALIVIRASACPATGQASFETRPEAARKADSQGNYRGRSGSDCDQVGLKRRKRKHVKRNRHDQGVTQKRSSPAVALPARSLLLREIVSSGAP